MKGPGAALPAAAIAILAALPAPAQEPAQGADENSFSQGLAGVGTLMEQARWKEALQELDALLKTHRDRDHVRLARDEIVVMRKRCAFHATYKEPDPQSLISGKLVYHKPKSSRIKLLYQAPRLGDFMDLEQLQEARRTGRGKVKVNESFRRVTPGARQSKLLVHPAVFKSYKLTLKGSEYRLVRLLVCASEDGCYDVVVGAPPRAGGIYFPTRIVSRQGSKSEDLVVKHWGADEEPRKPRKGEDTPRRRLRFPMEPGERYTVVLTVNSSRIVLKYNGKILARARKRVGENGQLGIDVDFDGVEEVLIEGTFDRSWLQNKLDKTRQKAFHQFDRRYDPKKDLPAWLFKRPAVSTAAGTAKAYPGDQQPEDIGLLNRAVGWLDKRRYRTVLHRVGKAKTLPRPVRAYLLASAHVGLGQMEEAEPLCEQVCAADPEYAPGRLLRGVVYSASGRRQEAISEYRATLRLEPANVVACEGLANLLLLRGSADEAGKALAAGRAAGIPDSQLAPLSQMVIKIKHGPNWAQRHTVRTDHYVISSDIDEKVCKDAGKVLEAALAYYQSQLGAHEDDGKQRRFRVYVFSGRAGFDAYCRDLVGSVPVHTNGLFSVALKQLLIWNLPSRREMLRTIRHEGFHQYLDQLVGDAPPWFNEGLAEYYENSRADLGRPSPGRIQDRHLRSLALMRKSGWIMLRTLTKMSHRSFYRRSQVTYPQSWALVHFLRRTTPAHRRIFDRLLEGLRDGKPYSKVWKSAFADADMQKLEKSYWKYIDDLRRKR